MYLITQYFVLCYECARLHRRHLSLFILPVTMECKRSLRDVIISIFFFMKAMILIPFHHRSENIQIEANTVRFDITLVRGPFI